MDELKTMLRDKAVEMRLNPEMPPTLRKRSRRRRVSTALLATGLTLGMVLAGVVGARLVVEDTPVPHPRPATEVVAPGDSLPIWPVGRAEDIDRIQLEVDRGHQPWYLSPEIVAQVFAMDVLFWDRDDIKASVRGGEPVQVVISNPALTKEAGIAADVRTTLTMTRWRDRPDGIFVITRADAEPLGLRSPAPGEDVSGSEGVLFDGTIPASGSDLSLLVETLHLVLGHEEEYVETRPFDQSRVSFSDEDDFAVKLDFPDTDWLAAEVFVEGARDVRLAVEMFRLGPPEPLPPAPEYETLPDAVATTRDAIQVAAHDEDWEALEALIDPNRFEFTFGGETDAISYWKQLQRKWAGGDNDGAPITFILENLLSYPGIEYEGIYMWPVAATRPPSDWTEADTVPLRRILYSEEQIERMRESDSYYGWRLGIEPDGTWIFFVAGD